MDDRPTSRPTSSVSCLHRPCFRFICSVARLGTVVCVLLLLCRAVIAPTPSGTHLRSVGKRHGRSLQSEDDEISDLSVFIINVAMLAILLAFIAGAFAPLACMAAFIGFCKDPVRRHYEELVTEEVGAMNPGGIPWDYHSCPGHWPSNYDWNRERRNRPWFFRPGIRRFCCCGGVRTIDDINHEFNERRHIRMYATESDDDSVPPTNTTPAACCMCPNTRATNAFVPCGHLCLCEGCKNTYTDDKCPLCYANFTSIIKLY